MKIEDLEELKRTTALLLSEKKKLSRLSTKAGERDLTPKQAERAGANANWQAMAVTKLEYEAHAIAVNCGIADRRDPEFYESIELKPSSFHRYEYTPRSPR